MRKLLSLFIAFLLLSGFTLVWEPAPSVYTNGDQIEPANLPVMYDAWQGGTQIANGITSTFTPLADNSYGAVYIYKVRTRLKDGRVSDNVVANLQNPFDQRRPSLPGAPLRIQ